MPNSKVSLGTTEIPSEIFHEHLRELSQTTFRWQYYSILMFSIPANWEHENILMVSISWIVCSFCQSFYVIV